MKGPTLAPGHPSPPNGQRWALVAMGIPSKKALLPGKVHHHRRGRPARAVGRADRLVMFLGSGVSMGAGCQTGVVSSMASRARGTRRERAVGFEKISVFGAGSIISKPPRQSFAMEIASNASKTHSFKHTLLSRSASGYVTTNYDELECVFCKIAGSNHSSKRRYARPNRSLLEHNAKRWLLKLHGMCNSRIIIFWFINLFFSLPSGDVETPRSIVLSRSISRPRR